MRVARWSGGSSPYGKENRGGIQGGVRGAAAEELENARRWFNMTESNVLVKRQRERELKQHQDRILNMRPCIDTKPGIVRQSLSPVTKRPARVRIDKGTEPRCCNSVKRSNVLVQSNVRKVVRWSSPFGVSYYQWCSCGLNSAISSITWRMVTSWEFISRSCTLNSLAMLLNGLTSS